MTDELSLANRAVQAMQRKDWLAAEPLLRELETRFPGKYRPHLALTLFNQQRHREALALLQALIDAGQTDINCIKAYAACLERTGEEARAINVLEQLYSAIPTEEYAVHLASALKRTSQQTLLDERLPALIAAHPEAAELQAILSEHRLSQGRWAEGFDLAGWRWAASLETSKADTLACEEWDGQPFNGLLLVTAEQGLGDEILASSLFADLARIGQRALIDCEPRLLPVFRRSFAALPGLAFADRHGDALHEACETHTCRKIPALELARYFRRQDGDFPTRPAWLSADPARRDALRAQLAARFPGQRLTGISWRSTRVLLGDAKSMPLTDLAPLLAEAGTTFIDLQYGDTDTERNVLFAATGIRIHRLAGIDTTRDIDELFALIAALDDVVSSSNTTVHVAAAQGMPVAALVPGTRYALWYWGYNGSRTRWYPSLTLYRGPTLSRWQDLATQIAGERAATRRSAS